VPTPSPVSPQWALYMLERKWLRNWPCEWSLSATVGPRQLSGTRDVRRTDQSVVSVVTGVWKDGHRDGRASKKTGTQCSLLTAYLKWTWGYWSRKKVWHRYCNKRSKMLHGNCAVLRQRGLNHWDRYSGDEENCRRLCRNVINLLKPSGYCMYLLPQQSLTRHFVFMGSVRFLQTIPIISLNSVNQLIFVIVKYGVLFEVRTEFLNNI
jgi:hypothetical protein